MSSLQPSPLLRQALAADALVSGVTGALMLAAAGSLATIFALPEELLRYAGLILLPFAALVGWAATRPALRPSAAWAVIGVNALWVVDSIALLLSGWVAPNALGYAFVVGQALLVAALAEAQYIGLRRASASGALA